MAKHLQNWYWFSYVQGVVIYFRATYSCQTIRQLVDLICLISLLSRLSFGSMFVYQINYHRNSFECVFRNQPKPVFYVASRGHHADIGGITPGSMPPHSHTLNEEGAVFTRLINYSY
jgi:hypothetical protein